jgi:hypothetical protein
MDTVEMDTVEIRLSDIDRLEFLGVREPDGSITVWGKNFKDGWPQTINLMLMGMPVPFVMIESDDDGSYNTDDLRDDQTGSMAWYCQPTEENADAPKD